MNALMKTALVLSRLISVYSFLIWIRILLSWANPYPRPGSFTYYIAAIIDPYLNLFRTSRIRMGMLDFSPVLAVGLLSVLQSVLNIYGVYGILTFGMILSLFISAFWSYALSIFLLFMIISLIIKTIASLSRSPMFYGASRVMTGISDSFVLGIRKLLFPNSIPRESTLSIISLVIMLMIYFVSRYAIVLLSNLALRIPF